MAVVDKDICKACEDLQAYAPEFVIKGVTDTMCANLEANQGLMNKGRKNCTDIHNAIDCLVGGMAEKAQAYDPCKPNQPIEDLAKNVMHVMDMLACSDCGQWEQIELIWEEIQKIWDAIHDLQNGLNSANGDIAKIKNALVKLLTNLKNSGAWSSSGDILDGNFVQNRNIATGNINVFGGTPDGNSYIRTNNSKTENDLVGGI
jgi:hypothetical protein